MTRPVWRSNSNVKRVNCIIIPKCTIVHLFFSVQSLAIHLCTYVTDSILLYGTYVQSRVIYHIHQLWKFTKSKCKSTSTFDLFRTPDTFVRSLTLFLLAWAYCTHSVRRPRGSRRIGR